MYSLIIIIASIYLSSGLDIEAFKKQFCYISGTHYKCKGFKLSNDINEISQITNLQGISMEDCEISDFNAVFATKFAPLSTHWYISNCKVGLKNRKAIESANIIRLFFSKADFTRNNEANTFESFNEVLYFGCNTCKFSSTNLEDKMFDKERILDIHIDDSNLISIGRNSFSNMGNLKSIAVINSYLMSIDPECCRKLSNLEQINFKGNKLVTIPNEVFIDNLNLLFIDLSYNKLKSVQPFTFLNNRKVKKLILSNNELTSVAENAFIGLRSLKTLKLNNNNLESIDIFGLLNIESLDLAYNKLKTVPDFSSFQQLSQLYLQNNELKIVYNVLLLPPSIEDIDISNNDDIIFYDNEYLKFFELNYFQMDNTKLSKYDEKCSELSKCDFVRFEIDWID